MVVIIASMIALSIVGSYNYSGYCIEKGNKINSEDAIEKAIDFYLTKPRGGIIPNFWSENRSIEYVVPIYYTKEALKASHPDCCSILEDAISAHIYSSEIMKLTGSVRYIVRIRYTDIAQRFDIVEGRNFRDGGVFIISNCGVVTSA